MTVVMIAKADTAEPYLEPISFVVTQKQLITIRYFDPQAFKLFILQLKEFNLEPKDALNLLIGLLEAAIDRLADILEFNGSHLDKVSQLIFRAKNSKKNNYQGIMQDIGVNADLNTKSRESLMAFNRLASFFLQSVESRLKDEERLRLYALSRDIKALNDYAHFISSKVTFLLDATLGMISIEQSNIIKIFSVAAVIFLPPTLIASIYGMNFKFMPELSYKWGYLMAILLMIVSAVIPYKYFKYKRWL
jgi:magnesium transporter